MACGNEASLRLALTSPKHDRHLQLIAASRKAMESAICIAMVISYLPGVQVTHYDAMPNDQD